MTNVVGLFDNYADADRAVYALQEQHVDRSHISLITRESDKLPRSGTAAGQGAVAGATAGGIIGLLAGLSAVIIPGIGPVIATGTIATAIGSALGLTAVGAGVGAVAGGLLGALVHMGYNREDAEFYAEGVKRGGVLVHVDTDSDNEMRVRSILHDAGAVDVESRRALWKQQGWTGYDETTPWDDPNYPRDTHHM